MLFSQIALVLFSPFSCAVDSGVTVIFSWTVFMLFSQIALACVVDSGVAVIFSRTVLPSVSLCFSEPANCHVVVQPP